MGTITTTPETVAGIRSDDRPPRAEGEGSTQGIESHESAGPAIVRRGHAPFAAGAAVQLPLDGEPEGFCARLAVQIPRIVRR